MGKNKTILYILGISVMSLAIIALIAVMIHMNKADNTGDPATNITNAASAEGITSKPDNPSKNDYAITETPDNNAAGTADAGNKTSAPSNDSNGTSASEVNEPTKAADSSSDSNAGSNNTETAATPTPAPTSAPAESPIKANATVTAGELNVRTGAGTDQPKLTVNGQSFMLKRNDRVEITGVKDSWFSIRVDANGTAAEGYAYGPYISPDSDSGYTAIAQPGSTVVNISSEKYKNYDNIMREWWYNRNTTHTLPSPGYANDISQKFPEFDAYYANTKVAEGDKVMYLTFDVGYENGYTTQILDTLKKHNVKVCFFVTTGFINQSPETAKRMKDEGHLVGNHTKNHPSLPNKTDEEVVYELTAVEDLFKEKTGYTLDHFMRPPQGDFSERTLKIQQVRGYKTIFWSLAIPNDWDNTKQDQIDSLGRFKADHHSGCIALVHATSKTNANSLDA
ncbi:MAG: polysaccharide deacetylase family protein, partial [Lachnospiraceae bacterium]|nr:polysaccharide deacetylase family protein [Lachnospiraceae bacterium]